MCGPPALAIAAAAATMAGQITKGVGEARQAKYESGVAKINSQMESDRARDAITRGQDDVRVLQNKQGQERGQMIAALAANGIDPSFGSASDVIQDQRQMNAEDQLAATHNYEREAMGYRINAANYLGQSRAAKSAVRGIIIGTALNVGSTALGAASQVGKINAPQAR
jgi:hypothetical protein